MSKFSYFFFILLKKINEKNLGLKTDKKEKYKPTNKKKQDFLFLYVLY